MDVITFPENLYTTSGSSILLHDIIPLPDGALYDKNNLNSLLYHVHINQFYIVKECSRMLENIIPCS